MALAANAAIQAITPFIVREYLGLGCLLGKLYLDVLEVPLSP